MMCCISCLVSRSPDGSDCAELIGWKTEHGHGSAVPVNRAAWAKRPEATDHAARPAWRAVDVCVQMPQTRVWGISLTHKDEALMRLSKQRVLEAWLKGSV